MTRYAWVFNLDAEFELARKGYNTPALLRDQLAAHSAPALALMGADDVIAAPGIGPGFVGRAWCPTPRALERLRALGITPEPSPSADVLRRVNHRRFAFELGGGLPAQRWIESEALLTGVLATGQWMLKRPLAFAGRGQLRVEGSLTQKQREWIAASLRQDGLIVEPLVRPKRELSLHGMLTPEGALTLGRPCVFREARWASKDETHEALVPEATRVAHALYAAGYFGPFGIDAYFYDAGFCALSEINARYTMSYALGFA